MKNINITEDTKPLLEITNVSKSYGAIHAVKNVSLKVYPGEILAIVGPSGCGKSTLLKLIAGFETLDNGDVSLNEKNINTLSAEKRGIGMVFQDYALFPHMNALQNVSFALHKEKDKVKKLALAKEYLEKLKIEQYEQHLPYQLSGGQQQRVAIARTFASNPNIILLDEPFSSIDETTREHTRKEISSILRNSGLSVIMVTHDCKEALSFVDRICVMNDGAVIQVGTPEHIYFKPKNSFVAYFIATTNILTGKIKNSMVECVLGTFPVEKYENTSNVLVSIRPEELCLTEVESENKTYGKIIHQEFTGNSYFYTVMYNGVVCVVRCSAYQKLHIDQQVSITVMSPKSLVVLHE